MITRISVIAVFKKSGNFAGDYYFLINYYDFQKQENTSS